MRQFKVGKRDNWIVRLHFSRDGRRLFFYPGVTPPGWIDLDTNRIHAVSRMTGTWAAFVGDAGQLLYKHGRRLFLLDTESNKDIAFPNNAISGEFYIAQSINPESVVLVSRDHRILVIHHETGEVAATLGNVPHDYGPVLLSPAGTWLSVIEYGTRPLQSRIHQIAVWRVADSRCHAREQSFTALVNECAFDPNDQLLAVASGRSVSLFEIDPWRKIWEWKTDLIVTNSVVLTPDDRFVLAARNDGTIRYLNARTGVEIAVMDMGIPKLRSMAVSPDGAIAAVGNDHGRIVVWDLAE